MKVTCSDLRFCIPAFQKHQGRLCQRQPWGRMWTAVVISSCRLDSDHQRHHRLLFRPFLQAVPRSALNPELRPDGKLRTFAGDGDAADERSRPVRQVLGGALGPPGRRPAQR